MIMNDWLPPPPAGYSPGQARVVFDLGGQRYEYDGDFPEELTDVIEAFLTEDGFWADRPDLSAQQKNPFDSLPDALWEIARIGGEVVAVHGQRDDGSILMGDWKQIVVN